MRDPERAPIAESDVGTPALERHGPCLICGEWIDGGPADDVCALTVERAGSFAEHVAHGRCLDGVTHAATPARDNYLAGKYRTPSGR